MKPYRPNVGVVVFNREGKVLAGERLGWAGNFQFPQGGIDDGETPLDAARRELYEEVGLALDGPPTWELNRWLHYDFPPDVPKKLKKYAGQKQRWFFWEWNGNPVDLDLDLHEREFERVLWMDFADVVSSIVEFKRHVYRELMAEAREQIPVLRGSA